MHLFSCSWRPSAAATLLLLVIACGPSKGEDSTDTASEGSSTGTHSTSTDGGSTSTDGGSTSTDGGSTSTGDVDLVACEAPAPGVGDVHFEITLDPEPRWWSFHLDVPCTITGTDGADSYDAIFLECDDDGAPLLVDISYDNGQLLLPAQELDAAVRLEIVAVSAESQGTALALHREDDQSLILGLSTGPFVPPFVDGVGLVPDFWAPFTIEPALTDCADEPGVCAALQRPAALRVVHASDQEALVHALHVATIEGYGIQVGDAHVDVGDENMCDGGVSTKVPLLIVNKPG
ncbi:MAG: hypothetical protein KC420_08455 [Myxococcales bacterium]|nr:hypothetical protein [Myxococcales bacterium]MCB9700385.1 hypothetical protein [Myxococcales bacterium]